MNDTGMFQRGFAVPALVHIARVVLVVLLWLGACTTTATCEQQLPNIVVVLFDDLGYGQPRCYRPDSEFVMPALERLALDGMRFTDAHSASAVCTPTRYGLLTGRYPFRIDQFGVLTTYSPPIIPAQRMTVASLLKQHGYHTACIGKWHLGMNWVDGQPGQQNRVPIGAQTTDGPNAVGFDYFCGFTHARNIGTIIEQDRVVAHVEAVDNQPLMLERALAYLDERARRRERFFLYFPLCPPHTPIVPAAEYAGKSGAKDLVGQDPKYGDWVFQGDDMLGQILAALERHNMADNTLVIVSSDNGAERREYPPLRASKRSIYEGGHRVPLIVRWPGKVQPGSVNDDVVCLNDLLATFADILNTPLPRDAGEDSFSFLPHLQGKADIPQRPGTMHQSSSGDLAIRRGPWKLIEKKNGPRELYHLENDISETTNVLSPGDEIEQQLAAAMEQIKASGRSTSR